MNPYFFKKAYLPENQAKLQNTSDSGRINKLADRLFVIPEYCITAVLSGCKTGVSVPVEAPTHSRLLFKGWIFTQADYS